MHFRQALVDALLLYQTVLPQSASTLQSSLTEHLSALLDDHWRLFRSSLTTGEMIHGFSSLMWDAVFARFIQPAFSETDKPEYAYILTSPWHLLTRLAGVVQADDRGPFVSQLSAATKQLPEMFQSVSASRIQIRQMEMAERSTKAAEITAAASSSVRPALQPSGVAKGAALPPALLSALQRIDAEYASSGLCRYWNGVEGSCRNPLMCPGSHPAGKTSAWYDARRAAYTKEGYFDDGRGNFRPPAKPGAVGSRPEGAGPAKRPREP